MSSRILRVSGPVQPSNARVHNRSAVRQHRCNHGPCSRAQLARRTGLTRVTISALVEDLLAEGIVEERGPEERAVNAVGRRGTIVALSTRSLQIAAIGITRDGDLAGAIMDLQGHILRRAAAPVPLSRGESGVTELTDFARALLALADRRLLGMGVSCPGIIDEEGRVHQAPNLGWYDLPLAHLLAGELGIDVHVANDANTSALGEYSFGGTHGEGLLSLYFGSGVGAGLILSGSLVLGARNSVGEIGHVTAVDARDERGPLGAPRPCACGRRGCLETITSVPSLRAAVEGVDPQEARTHLAAVGTRLGEILTPVVSTLDLTEIVLGGPEDLLAGPFINALTSTLRARTLPSIVEGLVVRMSDLTSDRFLSGAAVLVLSGELGIA